MKNIDWISLTKASLCAVPVVGILFAWAYVIVVNPVVGIFIALFPVITLIFYLVITDMH